MTKRINTLKYINWVQTFQQVLKEIDFHDKKKINLIKQKNNKM